MKMSLWLRLSSDLVQSVVAMLGERERFAGGEVLYTGDGRSLAAENRPTADVQCSSNVQQRSRMQLARSNCCIVDKT